MRDKSLTGRVSVLAFDCIETWKSSLACSTTQWSRQQWVTTEGLSEGLSECWCRYVDCFSSLCRPRSFTWEAARRFPACFKTHPLSYSGVYVNRQAGLIFLNVTKCCVARSVQITISQILLLEPEGGELQNVSSAQHVGQETVKTLCGDVFQVTVITWSHLSLNVR